MFMGWCFQSQLVLPCTNRHHIKPIFICLCLQGGTFSRILYFHIQTGTTTKRFQLFMFTGWCFQSQIVLPCTNRHQNKPIFSCLCLWGGALSRNFYFRVQAGTKTNLFSVVCFYGVVLLVAYCTSVYKQAPQQTFLTGDLVVYFFGVVLLVATCTSEYKQAPKQTYFYLFMFIEWCLKSHIVLPCTNRHHSKPI